MRFRVPISKTPTEARKNPWPFASDNSHSSENGAYEAFGAVTHLKFILPAIYIISTESSYLLRGRPHQRDIFKPMSGSGRLRQHPCGALCAAVPDHGFRLSCAHEGEG